MSNLHDLQVQRALYVLRYGNGVSAEIQKLLTRLERNIVAKLGERLAGIEERGFDLGPTVTARLEKALEEIRAVNEHVYGQALDTLRDNLTDLAADEMAYGAKALSKGLGIRAQAALASPQRLKSIVSERPIQGKLLAPWFKDSGERNKGLVEQIIRDGMSGGSTVDDMARGVRDVMGKSRASAKAIVRTSVNHVSTQAQMETYAANDVVKAWRFVATLDSRTTVQCASLSNRIFAIGKGPQPPRHPNCRSTIVAITNLEEFGIDPAQLERDGVGKIKKTPADSDPSFDEWMKGKGEGFQNEYLGETRARLWRDGKYSLQDFLRNDGTMIPLDELRKTHPD